MVDRYETARLACLRCLVKEFQRFAPSEQLASSSPCGREEELTDPLQEEAKQPLQRALGKEWQVVVDEGSLVSWEEVIDSPSYPSLTTQYKMQQLSAVVSGLPSSPFVTYESGAEGGKEHYWEWREDSPNDLRRRSECVESSTFSRAEQLHDWLAHYGVSTEEWGIGGLKSIGSLLQD